MNLSIDLQGHYYNHWPFLRIVLNDQTLFDHAVQQNQTLNFEVPVLEHNTLCFEHWGKQFGEQGIWDSDSHGEQSCRVEIRDIRFDDVSIGPQIMSNLKFKANWSKHQLANDHELVEKYSVFNSHGMMTFNGTIDLNFTTPIYNWLIDQKYKVPMTDTAYFSDYSSRWHYDEDRRLLEQIKELVKYDQNRSH